MLHLVLKPRCSYCPDPGLVGDFTAGMDTGKSFLKYSEIKNNVYSVNR